MPPFRIRAGDRDQWVGVATDCRGKPNPLLADLSRLGHRVSTSSTSRSRFRHAQPTGPGFDTLNRPVPGSTSSTNRFRPAQPTGIDTLNQPGSTRSTNRFRQPDQRVRRGAGGSRANRPSADRASSRCGRDRRSRGRPGTVTRAPQRPVECRGSRRFPRRSPSCLRWLPRV